jgi:hypothetical protein
MKAERSSETSVNYRTTGRYISGKRVHFLNAATNALNPTQLKLHDDDDEIIYTHRGVMDVSEPI